MKYLLDTDTCSAFVRRPGMLSHRFIQFGVDQIAVSAVTLAELFAGAYKIPGSRKLLQSIDELRRELSVLNFDEQAAEVYGYYKGQLARQGTIVPQFDLLIASIALAHDLTLVAHNTADFERIPDLRIEDWLTP